MSELTSPLPSAPTEIRRDKPRRSTASWNRVHLDVRPYPGDDVEAEAARLRALGAAAIDLGQDDVPRTVLADPEGNEFCLLAPG